MLYSCYKDSSFKCWMLHLLMQCYWRWWPWNIYGPACLELTPNTNGTDTVTNSHNPVHSFIQKLHKWIHLEMYARGSAYLHKQCEINMICNDIIYAWIQTIPMKSIAEKSLTRLCRCHACSHISTAMHSFLALQNSAWMSIKKCMCTPTLTRSE